MRALFVRFLKRLHITPEPEKRIIRIRLDVVAPVAKSINEWLREHAGHSVDSEYPRKSKDEQHKGDLR